MHDNNRLLVSSNCPRCYHHRVVAYTRSALADSIRTGAPIEFFCIDCGETWAISTDEREAIARDLDHET